jgi:hypothetical protein
MGLGNNDGGGNSKFVTIVGGKWTLRVQEGTEGAEPRELTKGPNIGNVVHELHFDHLSGNLVSGVTKTGEYGTDLCLDIESEGVVYNAQIPCDSDYFRTFAKCCEGVDVGEELFLGLGTPSDGGFPFLYVKQGTDTLKSKYTKDEPNGMPSWEKKEEMGNVKWDKTEQNNFCYSLAVDFLARLEDSNLPEA